MKVLHKLDNYVAEHPPTVEVGKKGGVNLCMKMPKMEGYYLKADLWNLAAVDVLMESWKER